MPKMVIDDRVAPPAAPPSMLAKPRLTAPLKWHGGKHYLAKRIVEMMPPHVHYVEPYAGGLAVLLAKAPTGSEVVNDVDRRLTNFWRVLQDIDAFLRFKQTVSMTPFSEAEWDDAGERLDDADPVSRAFAFFIRCRQSLAGRMDTFAPLSKRRTRRGMNEQAAAWLTSVAGLSPVHDRLKGVAILCRPALEVIRQQDGPGTLFYCDPPYLQSTRTAPDVYAHEMTDADHAELLETIKACKGKVMLSGYQSQMYVEGLATFVGPYDTALADWNRHTFDLPNNAAGGATKRRQTEVLWTNF